MVYNAHQGVIYSYFLKEHIKTVPVMRKYCLEVFLCLFSLKIIIYSIDGNGVPVRFRSQTHCFGFVFI